MLKGIKKRARSGPRSRIYSFSIFIHICSHQLQSPRSLKTGALTPTAEPPHRSHLLAMYERSDGLRSNRLMNSVRPACTSDGGIILLQELLWGVYLQASARGMLLILKKVS